MQIALAVAAGGLSLELLTHRRLKAHTARYLSLWAFVALVRTFWSRLCTTLDNGMFLESLQTKCTPGVWTAIHSTVANTQKADERTVAFLMHALSCLPVLFLGFLLQEGAPFTTPPRPFQTHIFSPRAGNKSRQGSCVC
jgi:hypothetical protein